MKLKSILSVAVLGLGLITAARAAEPTEVTSLDDIKSWVGEGERKIGVLIDFSGCGAFAWGYRWDGDRPDNETILEAILAADPRLKMTDENGSRALVYDAAQTERVIDFEVDDYFGFEYDDDGIPTIIWGLEGVDENSWQWLRDLEGEKEPWLVLAFGLDGYCDVSSLSNPWWAAEPYEGGGGGGGDDEKGFTFDDIHFWVGEGENQCAIVIDFFSDKAWAWGYRWSGNEPPSVEKVLKDIVEEDHRLTMVASDSSGGL